MARRAAILTALLALAAAGAEHRPVATVSRSGALTITLPADVLQSSEVRRQLTSGLTTVFVLSVTAGDGSAAQGGARIEVRYELWEEKYLVSATDISGQERKTSLDSEGALDRWWRENALTVIQPRKYEATVDVQVKLKVLPFSAREQSDTQRWLARTLEKGRAAGEQTPAQSTEILRIIVETSTRRRPLLEYQWSVRAVREAASPAKP